MTQGGKQPNPARAELERLSEVVSVLADEGLSLVVAGVRLRYLDSPSAKWRRLWRQSRTGRTAVAPAVRFRRVLERLGPTFIKLGQLLSTRPDVLPADFIAELIKLQDNVPPVSAAVVRQQIKQELGQPVGELFRRFEDEPRAAASLAQVHRAELPDGTPVAVKVRRPGIERQVKTDIRIILYLANQLERHLPWSRRFRPVKLAREFADWTGRELDFEHEAANIARFAALFADDEPELVIPEVYWPLTTPGVLVMELVEGHRLDQLTALDQAGIDRLELARLGLRIGFKQFLLHGFFHADPHPGNLTALPPLAPGGPPRLGIYDFGMVGQLSEKVRFELVSCFLAFGRKDPDSYADHVLDLADSVEGADLDQFRKEAVAKLSAVLWKPTQHKQLGRTFYEIILAASGHGILFSRELVLVGKAMLTLETVGLNLYPELDLDEEIQPFLKQVYKQETNPVRLAKQAAAQSLDNLYALKHFPEEARRILDRLANGQVGVRLDLQELHDLKTEFDRENDLRVLAVVAGAILLASALALGSEGWVRLLAQFGFIVSLILIGWTFVGISRRPRL
jgi:ubiquinone biosynthesis protein